LRQELMGFVLERMRGYYLDQGCSGEAFEAVLALRPTRPRDFDRRLRAVIEFTRRPEAASLAAANKRVANILRKQREEGGAVASRIDPALFELDAERALADALEAARVDTASIMREGDYAGVLARLAQLQRPVDRFFDEVLVNAEQPSVRANRLALLAQLHAQFASVADISRL
jgi:glycyl-tRNA synthetase beta chain